MLKTSSEMTKCQKKHIHSNNTITNFGRNRGEGLPQKERLVKLDLTVIQQMKILQEVENRKLLKWRIENQHEQPT